MSNSDGASPSGSASNNGGASSLFGGFTTFASQGLTPTTTTTTATTPTTTSSMLEGVLPPPPRPPLRNPGWQGRILEGTTYGFGAGLVGGALYVAWMEEVNVAPAIAGIAGKSSVHGTTTAPQHLSTKAPKRL